MIPTLTLHLHPEVGLVVQSPAGGLDAAGGPVSAAEGPHPEALDEGSWWSKTWTEAYGPEVTRAGLQSWRQTGPPGWAW